MAYGTIVGYADMMHDPNAGTPLTPLQERVLETLVASEGSASAEELAVQLGVPVDHVLAALDVLVARGDVAGEDVE